jgi:hypothetical protein
MCKNKAKVSLVMTVGIVNFIWRDTDDHLGKCVLFSGHSGPQHSSANVLELMSMFLLFFNKDVVNDVWKLVVTEQFINSS